MLNAGEIGARFTVDATPAMRALTVLADKLTALQAQFDKIGLLKAPGMVAMNEQLTKSLGLADDLTASLGKAGVGLNELLARATAQLERMDTLSKGSGGGGGGGGGGSAGAGGWGGWARKLAGLVSPELLGIGALGYGAYGATSVEDAAAKILQNAQQENTDEARKRVMDQIMASASAGAANPMKAAQAYLEAGRLLTALPFDKQLAVEGALFPSAAYESRMKGVELPDSLKAFVGLSHMAGIYDPAGMEKLANQFAFASTATSVPLDQFERTLGYSMPMLDATYGMSPDVIMALTALTNNAGIEFTRAGTWMRSLFEKAAPEDSTSKLALAHNKALQTLGLVDASGKSTWMVPGADGKTDWTQSVEQFSAKLNEAMKNLPDPAARISGLHTALGERGGSEAALASLDTFVAQLPAMLDKLHAFKGSGEGIDALIANSPMAQFSKTLADGEQVLTRVGGIAMPAFVTSLRGLDTVLEGINKALSWVSTPYKDANGKLEMLDNLGGGAQAATLPTGAAIHSALMNRPGAMANGGGPGDSFRGAVALPPPPVNVSVAPPAVQVNQAPTNISVNIDGQSVAAIVEKQIGAWISSAIGNAVRSVNGAASFDSVAHWSPPDAGGWDRA